MMNLPIAVRDAWHLVGLSRSVKKNKVVATKAAGVPIALFRNHQGIGALVDRCPHRNYPLSKGRVYQGALECGYHGWQFDQSGNCIGVPGCNFPETKNERLSARAVRVIERYGGIFVCLSPDASAEPDLPEIMGDTDYDHFWWQQGSWKGRAFDAIENVMDPFHTNHLHHGYIRRRDKRLPVSIHVNSDGHSIEMAIEQTRPDLGLMSRFLEKDRTKSVSTYFPPTIVQARWEGEKRLTLSVTAFFTPSDDHSFLPFACFTTPKGLAPSWLKQAAIRLFLRPVVAQDRQALEKQSETMKAFGAPKYLTGPGDLLGNRLYRLWNGETIESGSDELVNAEL